MRQELAGGKPLEPDVPPSRKMLHTVVDELPENSLAAALAMLEHLKFFPRPASPPLTGGGTLEDYDVGRLPVRFARQPPGWPLFNKPY
jgi:hypothetical protein